MTKESGKDIEFDETPKYGIASYSFAEGQAKLESGETEESAGVLQRSAFLRRASAVVFGAAAATLLPNSKAMADHVPAPAPCYGYGLCHNGCCNPATNRCYDECQNGWQGCHSGPPNLCWSACMNGNIYRCCDCKKPGHTTCICRSHIGTCA